MITNSGRPMQSINTMILAILVIFSGFMGQGYAQAPLPSQWKVEKNQQGVLIESRKNALGYFEVRATTEVASHPLALLALLDDTEAAPSWIARCRKVETLKWFGREERTVHTFFSAPWPFQDRDMVTFSKTEYEPQSETLTIKIEDKGREHATLNHYVRMENVNGIWSVSPSTAGKVTIIYQGYGDAAGSLPGWITNRLLLSSTHETFVNLSRIITLPKYQNTAQATITD